MIRSYTGSDFDHIDLCIKLENDPDEVYLLSANGDGVHVKKFSKTLRHLGSFYSKMVFRHLDFQRTE